MSVAVVIPAYKQAAFLGEAVQSVLAQTVQPNEIVIAAGDDESAEVAYKLARDFSSGIRVIAGLNKGVAHARNTAIAAACGDLIVPLDADDKLDPTFIEKTLTVFPTTPYVIVSTNVQRFGLKSDAWDLVKYSQEALLQSDQLVLSTTSLFSKRLWQDAGMYDVSLIGSEDLAFWIACSRLNPAVRQIPERLVFCRVHYENSTWSKRGFERDIRAMVELRHRDLFSPERVARDEAVVGNMQDDALSLVDRQGARFPGNRASQEFFSLVSSHRSRMRMLYPIPKILHQIWIGPKEPPQLLMKTWRDKHPDWAYMLWTDHTCSWRCQAQIDAMPEWNGKADIMRYEILEREGGVVVDADSECLKPLDDSFLWHDVWACWENEACRPGLIACGALGARPGSALMRRCVNRIAASEDLKGRAWECVGPGLLTTLGRDDPSLHIYPARTFIPTHFSGVPAPGASPIYARQFWGSTIGYDRLNAILKVRTDTLKGDLP